MMLGKGKPMKTITGILLCLLSLSSSAQHLSDGKDAVERGDFERGVRILSVFAQDGNAEAQRILGELIFNGQGVKQNLAVAVTWLTLAAKQGDRVAEYDLGYIYETGQGVAQSQVAAVHWYTLSATKVFPLAQKRLGMLYLESSPDKASYWLTEAFRNGDNSVAESMTKVNLVIAEQRQKVDADAARNKKEAQDRDREAYYDQRRNEIDRRQNSSVTPTVWGNPITLQSNGTYDDYLSSERKRAEDAAKRQGRPDNTASGASVSSPKPIDHSCDAVRAAGYGCALGK